MVATVRMPRPFIYAEAARQILAKQQADRVAMPEPTRVGSSTQEMWIPSDKLIVDDTYQRSYRPAWSKAIAAGFDPDKFRKLQVTPRDDGTFAVVDGQHRLEAIRIMHGQTPVEVLCDVTLKTGPEIEAKTFSAFNADIRHMNANEKFKAALAANDPHAIALTAALERHGFAFQYGGGKQRDNRLKSITALQRIAGFGETRMFVNSGPELLDDLLSVIKDAWSGSTAGVSAPILMGIASFINRYSRHDNYDRNRLIAMLRAISAHKLERSAGDAAIVFGGDNVTAIGRVLVGEFNKRLAEKNRLPEWGRKAI